MPDRMTVPVAGSIFTLLLSGTCFMGTMIFNETSSFSVFSVVA
jgi:hypothetical protein